MSSLFGGSAERENALGDVKVFGERYNGRYHLPLLPGEGGTKSGGDWVPGGVMSATNLAGALTDSRALAEWERERAQVGYAREPSLAENLVIALQRAAAQGVDLSFPALERGDESEGAHLQRAVRAGIADLHAEARRAGGAEEAARQGTNRHDAWEERGRSSSLFGTPAITRQVEALEELLRAHRLVRVPGLSERVIRNTGLGASGRFDDVLMSEVTGTLYMSDLKTKRRAFFSALEVWIQLAVYASADWMLSLDGRSYVPGPRAHVSQERAIVLHMPADGAPPRLARVDLTRGLAWARIARAAVDARADASSQGTRDWMSAPWSEED